MARRGLAEATRVDYGRAARGFLSFLESAGFHGLEDACPGSVLDFLAWLAGHGWASSSLFWVASNLRPFLKFAGRQDLVDSLNMAGVTRTQSTPPVLDDADVGKIIDTCSSDRVSSRDAAITMLALSTGLRAIDIINLRLGDVDWPGLTIRLVQHKTGNPLVLPMIDVLAARLADYVLNERPAGVDTHLFLRVLAPFHSFADHAAIHAITSKTIRLAGVDRACTGTRFLRHCAASRLLRAGSPLPTIAAVLGHSDMDSTRVYLATDTDRLLECVLPLPKVAA